MIDSKYIKFLKNKNIIIDSNSIIDKDAVILANSIILGNSRIEKNAIIGPNSIIIDSIINENSYILNSYVVDSVIGLNTTVGPFANIKKNTTIGDKCRIGNYVEIKNSSIKNYTKAAHLAYIGDSEIGERCNFGCGSITVNYDGKNKYKTIVGNDVFIGSNSNLVAPIKLEDNSFIACGSTITSDVPKNTLSIARSRQINKTNYFNKDTKE
jgi:bifunctional UDP-N-acetylglucosamine pyrophosphorylase/glucosamine-1-phosphate N-acetyltransferase